MNCRTNCCKTFVFVFALLALTILAMQATPAYAAGICSTQGAGAGNCLQNESCAAGVTQKLNCTANDVRVAKVINTRNPDGSPINSCIAGQTGINFVADFLVQTSSTSSRSNIGLYFSEFDVTQQPTALTGSCSDNVISPPHHTTGVSACLGSGAYNALTCAGFGTYDELDPNEPKNAASSGLATGCGDTTSQDGTVCLTANDNLGNATAVPCGSAGAVQTFTATQVVTVEIKNFTCPNVASGTQVQLPNCTSWQIPGGTIACTASPNDYQYPDSPPTAIPGTPSKCNCAVVSLPIIVQTPNLIVEKACEPGTNTLTSGSTTPTFNPLVTPLPTQSPTTCDAGAEGANPITYYVALTNNSNTGGTTVDQICDDVYGTIYRRSGYTGAFCNGQLSDPGFLGDSGGDNCTGPYDLAKSSTPTQCTFLATPNKENLGLGTTAAITDQLTVSYHGDLVTNPPELSAQSNSVSVTSSDAPSSAITSPGPASTPNVCVTLEYNATVRNTSAADEDIYLHGISDNGLNLTTLSPSTCTTNCIVGTTCGVTDGLGTLTGTGNGAGVFPTPAGLKLGHGTAPTPTADGGHYDCTFDVLVCGTPVSVEKFGTGICSGSPASPGTCTNSGGPTGSCTTNAQCDTSCIGIKHTDQLSATLTGDETSAPLDTISPVVNKTTSVTECVSTSQTTQ